MTTVGTGLVGRRELRIGALLAEGGEGRVYELDDRRGTLYKEYRTPGPLGPLRGLVDWAGVVEARDAELARRVAAGSAWPSAVVVDDPAGATEVARGLLIPRAPRRFSLRHRDGEMRLATLSYLTTSPGQRAAAYGLALPPAASVERIGIVYALARLLEAFQAATPSIGHGDLSTKNVLWSLERGPEVFLLDCDSAERYAPGGVRLDAEHRRRAMTPNWDDPAIPPGANPTPESDRYSLALIFLRVVAAAHFPIQGRQRRDEPLSIDFAVPPTAARARSLDADAPVWELCERSLDVGAVATRPPASAWAAALEEILDDLGAMRTVRAVWAAQGGGAPGPTPPLPVPAALRPRRDVVVRPVVTARRPERWARTVGVAQPAAGVYRPSTAAASAATPASAPPVLRGRPNPLGPGGLGPATIAAPGGAVAAGPTVRTQAWDGMRRAARAWMRLHRRMLRRLATRGRRGAGLVRLVGCVALDLVLLLWALFLAAMLVSPFLRI
jgi:hypothetical protein